MGAVEVLDVTRQAPVLATIKNCILKISRDSRIDAMLAVARQAPVLATIKHCTLQTTIQQSHNAGS